MLHAQAMKYADRDPIGFGGDKRRGAAMGRPQARGDGGYSGVLVLKRVRIDADGYDGLGTYWGIGAPLWWWSSGDGSIDRTARAANRDEAVKLVLFEYPNAKVRR